MLFFAAVVYMNEDSAGGNYSSDGLSIKSIDFIATLLKTLYLKFDGMRSPSTSLTLVGGKRHYGIPSFGILNNDMHFRPFFIIRFRGETKCNVIGILGLRRSCDLPTGPNSSGADRHAR